jgi:hypothetical protein
MMPVAGVSMGEIEGPEEKGRSTEKYSRIYWSPSLISRH